MSKPEEHRISPKINENKIRITDIDREIEGLLTKVAGADAILMEYINNKVENLDADTSSERQGYDNHNKPR